MAGTYNEQRAHPDGAGHWSPGFWLTPAPGKEGGRAYGSLGAAYKCSGVRKTLEWRWRVAREMARVLLPVLSHEGRQPLKHKEHHPTRRESYPYQD